MKKTFLFLLLLLLFVQNSNADKYESSESISLGYKFIMQLRANTPFSYEDECFFFGEKTAYSYVILHKLGYLDEKGQWIKKKPKYSYLCELIRLNSDFILLPRPCSEYYFAGAPQIVSNDGSLFESTLYGRLAYVQGPKVSQGEPIGNSKIVIITYRIPQKRIDFPILVNETSLAEKLGFVYDRRVPRLKEDILNRLVEHINKLDRQ